MKIAISSAAKSTDSKMDSRFGRCECFAIIETDTMTFQFVDNPAKNEKGGAGVKAVQFIISKGVKRVYAIEFGPKVTSALKKAGVKMINVKDTEKPIKEIVEQNK